MGEIAKKRATYQDVLDAPPHHTAQVLFGVLHTFPRPAMRHTHSSSRVGAQLDGPFGRGKGGPGGWLIFDEPELHLGSEPDIVVPDIAGWRRERMPSVPAEPFLTLAPDWVCEVLSPSTEKIDRGVKMDIYAREGVSHTWLVDPVERLLEVYVLERGAWTRRVVAGGDDVVRAEPFDAIEIELASLWA